MNETLSLYLLPPTLCLISGVYLTILAFARGAMRTEKILFALVCIWYSLLAPVFICHNLIHDQALLLTIERRVHFFYVYLPAIQVLFYHHILEIRRKGVVMVMFGLSFLLSLTTQGDYYFQGLNSFSWGNIARGGVAFQLFGLYGAGVFVYCVGCFIKRLRVESNPRLRLKFKYMLFSFGMTGALTLMNLPAIQGIDFYPLGNFSFLPLVILAYGLLKHRLLEIRSLLHLSLTRVLLLMLIVVPNFLLFAWSAPHITAPSYTMLFVVLAIWFSLNYFYIRWVKSLFERWFYKERRGLKKAEARLIKEILELRRADDLAAKVNNAICDNLAFDWARVYVYDESAMLLVSLDGDVCAITDPLVSKLPSFTGIIEKAALNSLTIFMNAHEQLHCLMFDLKAAYMIALVHNQAFIGLLALPEKENRQPISPDEAAFVKSIAGPLAVALSNAVMFQRISKLKDGLQARTDALTQEIAERERAEQELKSAQNELNAANLELEKAILQANEMHAKVEIGNHVLTKEMEERKSIEAALRKSEAMYRLIADNSADVIWTIDLKDSFTYLSPSVYHLLGYTPEEMVTMKISAVLTAHSLQIAEKTLAEDYARVKKIKGRPQDRFLELEQVRKDGTTVWTEVNTRFIQDSDGAIRGILGVTRDITARRKSEQELLFMAYHDALTGLYNRKAFIELLDSEIKYAQRYQSGLAVLFFDLNKFKLVNDTHGHQVGDHLLKAVAERLRESVRETDLIARLGGDEFTIILRNPEDIFPDLVAERIVAGLAQPFFFADVRIDMVTASIGIAIFPKDGTTVGALIKSADLAMYEAKNSDTAWLHFEERMAKAV